MRKTLKGIERYLVWFGVRGPFKNFKKISNERKF